MDLQEQRLNCLRMAYELGGKPEAIIMAANSLMNFVLTGLEAPTPAAAEVALSTEAATETDEARSTGETELPPSVDPIAACGTALLMPEGGDLSAAEPASLVEIPPAELTAVPTSELPSQDKAEEVSSEKACDAEVAPIIDPIAEDQATEETQPTELAEESVKASSEESREVKTEATSPNGSGEDHPAA